MKTTFIQLFSTACGSAFAAEFYTFISKKNLGKISSLILATVIAVFLYKVIELVLIELPIKSTFIRPFLDPRSLVEGYWLQVKRDRELRPYSFITISFNKETKEYLVTGISYDINGKIGAVWKSTQCFIDIRIDQVMYLFKAEIHCDGGHVVADGYTVMTLIKNLKGEYQRGTGYYIDTRNIKSDFILEKINKSDIQDSIGKKEIDNNTDMKNLIKCYHEKMKETIFTNANEPLIADTKTREEVV